MSEIQKAEQVLDECWFIFSMTGDIQDARLLIEAVQNLDLLLSAQDEAEL